MLLSKTSRPTEAERKIKAVSQIDGQCFSCEYSISVRNVKYGLPYRQYLWKGGKNPVDMPILDAHGNPEKEADGITNKIHPEADKDWCFAYGESESMKGENWSKVQKDALGKVATNTKPAVTPVGRVSCE